MLERAKDLARLEQALRPPKARGGFGELLLENLLRDRLPPSAYEMQYTFDSGERVDALVKVDRIDPDRLQVPARQLQPPRRGRERRRANARRAAVRARRQAAHRGDRGEVHPAGRGHVRLRLHVHPGRGGLLRARVRQDRSAARVRARATGLPRLADDLHGVPPGDRAGPARNADRAARPRGHGVRRRAAAGLRPLRATTSTRSARTSATHSRSTTRRRSGSTASRRSSSGPSKNTQSSKARPSWSSQASLPTRPRTSRRSNRPHPSRSVSQAKRAYAQANRCRAGRARARPREAA